MKKQPEITAATKKRIMDAFWEVYEDKRIEKVTVSAVTQKAHIHRSTFYEYFTDVYELLDTCETEILDYLKVNYANVYLTRKIDDFEQFYPVIIQIYQKFAPRIHKLLGSTGDPAFKMRILSVMKPYFHNVTGISMNDRYFELKLNLFFSTVLSIFDYWYNNKDTLTVEEIVPLLVPILSNITGAGVTSDIS